MKAKKFAALLLIFVATFAALIWIAVKNAHITRAPILEGIKANQIIRLEIDSSGKTVELIKENGLWEMKKPISDLADQDSVSQIATALPQIILEDIATKDPASYPDYGISSSSATHLVAYASISPKPILNGYFGRQAFGWDSAYFRFSKMPDVYMTSGLNSSRLAQDPDNFRERAFFPKSLGTLSSIEVLPRNAKAYTLSPSSPTWATVSSIRLSSFINATPLIDHFKKPRAALKASLGNQSVEWLIGDPQTDKSKKPIFYYAKSENRGLIGLVSSYEVDTLLPQKPVHQTRKFSTNKSGTLQIKRRPR